MEKLIIVSCDGHVGCPVKEYTEYLDPKYRHLMPEMLEEEEKFQRMQKMFNLHTPERLAVMDEGNRIASGGLSGGWDVERRLKELDSEGVTAEVIFPGTAETTQPFFYQFNKPYPDDVRMAGLKAYHRWAAEHMIAPSKGRIIGTADPGPSKNLDEAIQELEFCAERGFRSVFLPGFIHDAELPPLSDHHYERFWAACNDLGYVLSVHAGWGTKQGEFTKLVDQTTQLMQLREEQGEASLGFVEGLTKVMSMMSGDEPDSIFKLDLGPRRAIWQLIFSGVFDRYPKLKVVITECRADWVPTVKAQLDARYLAADNHPKLKMKPSEYFGINVFVSPSSPRRAEVESRKEIGIDNFLFATDYPHPEGTWPNTLTWLRTVFYDVSESDLRAILGENAVKVYGLDREMLAGVAAKIGHKPSDIIGDHPVDEAIVADFEFRSQFTQESPQYEDVLAEKIDADLAVVTA